MSCAHEHFDAQVRVVRLTDTQDGDGLACQVEVRASCADCQTPVQFALPMGLNLVRGAWMSPDGTEARLPARLGIPKTIDAVRGFGVRGEGLL